MVFLYPIFRKTSLARLQCNDTDSRKNFSFYPIYFWRARIREVGASKKADSSWFVEAWGLPSGHSTLNVLYPELWKSYEDKLIVEQNEEGERIMNDHGLDCLFYPRPRYD